MSFRRSVRQCVSVVLVLFMAFAPIAFGQGQVHKMDSIEAQRMREILKEIYVSVKKNYYDPTFHGLDIDDRFHKYDEQMKDAATPSAAFRLIAAFLTEFHDSHLFFSPPARNVHYDTGYKTLIVGDKSFVTQIRPHSDAEKHLHIGDRVVNLNGYEVNREDSHEMDYFFHRLAPLPAEKLDLQDVDGKVHSETIKSAIRQVQRRLDISNEDSADLMTLIREEETDENLTRERVIETEPVMYWKMAEFGATPGQIDGVFDRARNHKALILDLRGNPGGAIVTLEEVVGNLFDHEVKIADRVSRKVEKGHETIKSRAVRKPFKGQLIVVVDSRSASCSELLARVVQLEKRGTVIGDKTAGAVMESRSFGDSVGLDTKIFYGLSVTSANLLMTDGKSLENVGVAPDMVMLPTASELAAGEDSVLSHAATMAGATLDPVAAGKMFPYEWSPL